MKFLRELTALIRPYWTGDEKVRAWLLGTTVIGLNLFQIFVLTVLTFWQSCPIWTGRASSPPFISKL